MKYYHLDIAVHPEDSTIEGKNTIRYTVLEPYQVMQIDLQPPLIIYKALQDGNALEIVHEGNAHFIQLSDKQEPGKVYEIEIYYGGKPHLAEPTLGWRDYLEKRPEWLSFYRFILPGNRSKHLVAMQRSHVR